MIKVQPVVTCLLFLILPDFKMENPEEHIWLGSGGSPGCPGELSIPYCSVFLHPGRSFKKTGRSRGD